MRAVDPAARITFAEMSEFPGLETPAASDVVGLAKRLAGNDGLGKVAYGTEAGLFARAGIPTVVIGPGSIEQAHKPNEFVTLEQVGRCEAFLRRLMERLCA